MELQFKTQKALTISFLFLIIALLGFSNASREQSIFQYEKTTVTFTNELVDKSEFTIHCSSDDDDLGIHVVSTGQVYQFTFRPGFWGKTIFICKVIHSTLGTAWDIEAYKEKRDLDDRCKTLCEWSVNKEGVFGYPQTVNNPPVKDIWVKWEK